MTPVRAGFILAAFVGSVGVLGKFDIADEISREADEKVARPARAIAIYESPAKARRMSHPLGCDARMRASAGGLLLHDGCYVKGSLK